MTLELRGIAERLKKAGYPVGGKLLSDSASSWEKSGLIPHELPNTSESSPERKPNWEVWRTIEAGGRSVAELERTLKQNKINVSGYAQDMMRKPDFITLKSREAVDLVQLKVSDLGFTSTPTTDQIYQKAESLGLGLCPPEVGPELRLKYKKQSLNEWLYIGMKQIAAPASGGDPSVFGLDRDGDGAWLDGVWAGPDNHWALDDRFVFRLRE